MILSPLPPVGHPNSASDPVIQITTQLIAIGDTKIVDPAAYVLTGFKELVAHADTPVSVGQFPYSLFKFQQRFRVPFDMSILECKSQELTLAGFHHLTFLCVDHKL